MARIFLCHATEDKAQVREVYHRLQAIDVGDIAHAGRPIAQFGKQHYGRSAHIGAVVDHSGSPAPGWWRPRS